MGRYLTVHNKKAAAYLAYVLLIMVTVAMATIIITWSLSTTKELTESSVTLASGRLECKEVRIDAVALPGCNAVTVYNKGTINIEKVMVTFDFERQVPSTMIPVSGSVEVTDEDGQTFSNVVFLPIVKERNNLFGCVDKKLQVNCSP